MSEKEKVSEENAVEKKTETNDAETNVTEVLEEDQGQVTEEKEVSEVDALKAELDEMEDKFLRARAEIANMTNRNRNERESLIKYRSQDLGKKILPVIDNLERALTTEVADEAAENLKKGVQMVYDSLMTALKEEGIEEILAQDQTFDPSIHQAVQTVPADSDHPAETVVQVLQKGYQLRDRILRPSMVIVAQ